MKVLSIRQPWASLIVKGCKDVENRTWKTDYRGPIAIHASGTFDWSFFKFIDEFDQTDVLRFYVPAIRRYFGMDGSKKITKNQNKFSAIIGTVMLDHITPPDEAATIIESTDQDFSDWASSGCYWWHLSGAKELENPIPCKGKLNLWNYD